MFVSMLCQPLMPVPPVLLPTAQLCLCVQFLKWVFMTSVFYLPWDPSLAVLSHWALSPFAESVL